MIGGWSDARSSRTPTPVPRQSCDPRLPGRAEPRLHRSAGGVRGRPAADRGVASRRERGYEVEAAQRRRPAATDLQRPDGDPARKPRKCARRDRHADRRGRVRLAGRPRPIARCWSGSRRTSATARRTASVCTGAFLLAAAGLLDGRRATTHWASAAELAARYPAVDVDPEPIFLRDGPIWTSAGVTAGMDLALALVEEDLDREAALADRAPSRAVPAPPRQPVAVQRHLVRAGARA